MSEERDYDFFPWFVLIMILVAILVILLADRLL